MTAITLPQVQALIEANNLGAATNVIVINHVGDEVKLSTEGSALSYDADEDVITIQLAPVKEEPDVNVKDVTIEPGQVIRVSYTSVYTHDADS